MSRGSPHLPQMPFCLSKMASRSMKLGLLFERTVSNEPVADFDDVYKLFNDTGYEEEVERLIRGLKVEDKF